MRESILTIPIHEIFEPKEGCPLCRMRDMLEQRCVEYIMGAAMMEPDVRIETNRLGFCREHYPMLMQQRNRLGLGLMLQTHLSELRQSVAKGKFLEGKSKRKQAANQQESCFVCNKIDWAMERLMDTVCTMFVKDSAFRQLFSEQEYLCLPHYRTLCEQAYVKMHKREVGGFVKASTALVTAHMDRLQADVDHFCSMFDYRNSGKDADWGTSRDAIERTVLFLTTRPASQDT